MSSNNLIVAGFDDTTDQMLAMKLELIKKVENCCVVRLDGVIDTYNSIFFQNQMNRIVQAGYTNLIISCENLKYISSTGVGNLLVLLKHLKSNNGQLIMSQLQSNVVEVLDLLGFRQFFCLKDSLEEAIVELNRDVVFSITADAYPMAFTCPLCDAKLRAPHSGKFRCLSCKSVITVADKPVTVAM